MACLTTDEHKQLRRYMRKEKGKINNQPDVWHVAKNIKKNWQNCANKSVLRN